MTRQSLLHKTGSGVALIQGMCWCALALLAGWVYWPVLSAGLVWDDIILVQDHDLMSLQNLMDKTFGSALISNYYRPIPLASIAMASLAGEAWFLPVAHASSLFCFVVIVALMMALTRQHSASQIVLPGLAGLLVVAHPAFLELVAWISGRFDLLLIFFCLSAMWLDVKLVSHPAMRNCLVALCMFLAAFCKETAVVMPVILVLWRLYSENIPCQWQAVRVWLSKRDNAMLLVCLFCAGLAYLLVRYYAVGHLVYAQHAGPGLDTFSRVLLAAKTFSWFLLLQILPQLDVSAFYLYERDLSFSASGVLTGFLLFFLCCTLLCLKVVSSRLKYLLLVLLAIFLPMSNILDMMLLEGFTHLRFVALPTALLVVMGLPLLEQQVADLSRLLISALAVLMVCWVISGLSVVRAVVPMWASDDVFWRWVVVSRPQSGAGWANHLRILQRDGNPHGCVEGYAKATSLGAYSHALAVNAAQCYYSLRDYAQVVKLIDEMLERGGRYIALPRQQISRALYLRATAEISSLVASATVSEVTAETFGEIAWFLEKAYQNDPANIEAILAFAAWLMMGREETQAVELLSTMVKQGLLDANKTQAQLASSGWLDSRQLALFNDSLSRLSTAK